MKKAWELKIVNVLLLIYDCTVYVSIIKIVFFSGHPVSVQCTGYTDELDSKRWGCVYLYSGTLGVQDRPKLAGIICIKRFK